jgi:hypothetical protein
MPLRKRCHPEARFIGTKDLAATPDEHPTFRAEIVEVPACGERFFVALLLRMTSLAARQSKI